mmetsp:Transcript_5420/g.7549  ORF Transcript_5420/g.7549 Transcript_5420/m.7549 type:complete len:124 (-) Transcript_5420:117-488(-)
MFKTGDWKGRFQTFDEEGFPLTEKDGQPVSKKLKKKLTRLHAAQKKKWEKHKMTSDGPAKMVSGSEKEEEKKGPNALMKGFGSRTGEACDVEGIVRLVAGSFGNRQGFTSKAELGPFSHVLDF